MLLDGMLDFNRLERCPKLDVPHPGLSIADPDSPNESERFFGETRAPTT